MTRERVDARRVPREQEDKVVQRDRGECVPVALEALEASRVELEEDVEASEGHCYRVHASQLHELPVKFVWA